jgi:biofilm PGA synthesis N-glycosyltransferase PgaC
VTTRGRGKQAPLTYALVTPARNEEDNLRRLARCIREQTVRPARWIVVDNGSTDGTADFARELADSLPYVSLTSTAGEAAPMRGAAVVRAFAVGLGAVQGTPDIVVKLDADVSFEADHFERLLERFAADPTLGIAGSLCYEQEKGRWVPRYTTRSHVRGAVRAYRQACLKDVLPLEERMGWDGIDEIRAAVRGWRTATFHDIPFHHHRALGGREPATAKWVRQGEMAHYMGYRPVYLTLRSLYRALREPSALAMVWGYARAAARRGPQYPDVEVRAWLRREQSLRRLRRRAREALGRANPV